MRFFNFIPSFSLWIVASMQGIQDVMHIFFPPCWAFCHENFAVVIRIYLKGCTGIWIGWVSELKILALQGDGSKCFLTSSW
jgi:hypothetical protein